MPKMGQNIFTKRVLKGIKQHSLTPHLVQPPC
jgi:hypothetical protein